MSVLRLAVVVATVSAECLHPALAATDTCGDNPHQSLHIADMRRFCGMP
jgi:hypothetical protein